MADKDKPYITKKKKEWITKKDPEDTESTKQKWITKKKKTHHLAKGGRAGFADGGRTKLLEELGRVEAEPSNKNRRAEISRVHGELNKGYNKGGRVGFKHGSGRPKGGWTS
jgi:hypothetical protein